MATSARRIGLYSRSGRKASREDDCSNTKATRKISREELSTIHDSACLQSQEIVRKISYNSNAPAVGQCSCTFNTSRHRKVSVYSRPDVLDANTCTPKNNATTSRRTDARSLWQEFLNHYAESFILGTLFLVIITVSLYIVFVEGQSLIGKEK